VPYVSHVPHLAEPWWVNLLALVPVVSYSFWRRTGLAMPRWILAVAAVFGTAFGFVEAAVVAYLQAAIGLSPASADPLTVPQIPPHLLRIEVAREAATIVMLLSVAFLAARRPRERWALFLYMFAFWDLVYYAGLRVLVGWPDSLLAQDVLFLIPVPWIAGVWYPVLVSTLTILAVLVCSAKLKQPS
jgi:hypothetical protein